GGREFSALLDGAPADLGTEQDLHHLLQTQTFAIPAFAHQGGPFMAQQGYVLRTGQRCELQAIKAAGRSALAALYCAQMTAWLVQCLRPETYDGPATGSRMLVVEGPLARNQLCMGYTCFASVDELEGTARGAWLLSRWNGESHVSSAPDTPSFLQAVRPSNMSGLHEYHQRWVALVAGQASAAMRP
ncbi:MAG: hypothetical protein ABL856_08930, partial [Gallionella sp.]